MPPRASLKTFLATARAALTAPPARRISPLTFVVGNESADLDSLCSALLLAYFRTYAPRGALHIPICHLHRADLALRPEFAAVLRDAEVRSEDVFTLEDVGDIRPEQTRWVLVDHNAMTGPLAKTFASRVVGCVDHHVDEGVVPANAETRIIRKCGSCASLVLEDCAGVWDGLTPEPDIDAALARLGLACILVDTAGLRDAHKTTETDVRAAGVAERRVWGYDRAAEFARFLALKEELGGMALRDVLRKDYKAWEVCGLRLGTSSVPRGFGYLVREKGFEAWTGEGGGDLMVVLTGFRDPAGVFCRELLVWGRSAFGVRAVRVFEERNAALLGLETWEGGRLDLDEGGSLRRCWRQGAVGYSRKQIAPMLRDALREVAGAG